MSFRKAADLLTLATLAAARRQGLSLADVVERFECSTRTAQRMLAALADVFGDVETVVDETGRKRWRLPPAGLKDLATITAEELADLDLAVRVLEREGQIDEARRLEGLREKIRTLVPPTRARRLETDEEALLAAQGLVARPGPRRRAGDDLLATVGEAIKSCRLLAIDYRSRDEDVAHPRLIAPYGLLTGIRRYVVGKDRGDLWEPIKLYRLEGIVAARLTEQSFVFDEDFDLQAFANRAFGVFQNDREYGEVVWRFRPDAADHARGFVFHPDQMIEDQPDGSLLVRFRAAGYLEMCWYLYSWGDRVEVLEPEALKTLCEGFRRSDFAVLP